MMALRGECFSHQKGRLTQRIQLGDKSYLSNSTQAWAEKMLKNLLQFRWPYQWEEIKVAIEKLNSLGVAVPVYSAYGNRGINPARLQSFILMEELAPGDQRSKIYANYG